jgi:hypothetical protein
MDVMRIHRLLLPIAAICCALLMATTAQAKSGSFKISVSGTQSLSWSLNGTTGTCEIRSAVGSGTNKFSFKSPKSTTVFVSSSAGVVGSLNAVATGTRTGSFTTATVTPCPDFEPSPTFSDDASGCGAFKYNLRLDFKQKNAFQYVTGPGVSNPSGLCPSPTSSSLFLSTELTQCGDGNALYKRSFGISGDTGLLASRLSLSTKKLLKTKKGKSKTITGTSNVECSPPSSYNAPLTIRAQLKYKVTFKRVS